ncbi:Rab-GTPase-TBC domain family protein [Leishmania donovani]|uniref:Rab-GTPase-TBC domain family protein n=1 Tax=Leishmania donovani TaxID=5661 RepID=A0A504XG16_LEIDO|nr:Rab-GTPase-TBC domain family protein [Leishmania donovani]
MMAVAPTQDVPSVSCGASRLPESFSTPSSSPLQNRSGAAAHPGRRPSEFQPPHSTIATLVAGMEEDGAVGFLPFCVQRLRGPGRVRRVPPGTAYRSAGALLRRLLRYNEDGEVRVEVVREAPKNQDTKSTRTRSQARRERASILAMETERRYAAEQESRLSFLLQALPLLRVVPPQCLLQQAYTEEQVSEPGSDVFTPPNISRSFNPSPPASSSAVVAHRDPSQLGSGSSSSSDVDGDGRNTGGNAGQRGAATATNSYVRGAYRLGLGFAVLLTPEEAAGLHETPPRRTLAQRASTAATAGGSGVGDGKDRTSSLNLLSTVNTTAAPSRAESLLTTVHEEAASTRAAATSRSTDVLAGKPPVSVEPNSLRCVAWGGCRPALLRAVVWRLLSDYAPAAVTRQKAELQRKRRQYEGYTRQYCSALTMLSLRESPSTLPSMLPLSCSHGGGGAAGAPGLREAASLSRLPGNGLPPNNGHGLTLSGGASSTSAVTSLSPYERAILQQMLLDLPRHQSPIFHAGRSLAGMARCLFLWSQRHPAVGYVQGMDDVVAVFYHVFLADALRQLARVSAQAATCTRASHRQTATHEGARRTSVTAAAARLDSGSDDGEGDDSDDKAASANGAELGSMACDKGTRAVMRLLVSSLSASVQRTSWSSTAASTPTALATPITMTTLGTPATRATTAAALSPYLSEEDLDVLSDTPAALDAMLAELPESYLTQVEGDTYWCAGRVLSLLQDNFMPGQPGILRNVRRLEALVRAVDPSLIAFLDGYGLTVMDGCFQWLHSASGAHTTSSLAATVAAQGSSASDEEIMHFHVCVCCALLRNLRANLLDNSSQTSTLNAPAATSGRWGAAALATHPFEALFPQYASAKQEQQHPLDREDKHERCGERARARTLEAAMRWLDILIADAYCIWRKHPMHG